MKGKDPRDAHQITSRICGICGDNHATASVYAQQMAYGIKPPHLAEWIINLAEAAEYMFDHNLYQENLVGVDFCARMVGETNPGRPGPGRGHRGAPRRRPRLPHHRRHHAGLQPHGGRPLPGGAQDEPPHPGDVLPDGGAPRPPLAALPGRRRHRAHRPALRRLPGPAGEVRRAPQAHRPPPRRPLRLHVRGPARLRGGGPAADPPRLVGLVPGPGDVRLPLRPHDLVGTRHVRDARASWSTASWSPPTWSRSTWGCGSSSAARSTTTGPRARPSSPTTPWATPSTSATRGTRPRRPDPSGATSSPAATTRG